MKTIALLFLLFHTSFLHAEFIQGKVLQVVSDGILVSLDKEEIRDDNGNLTFSPLKTILLVGYRDQNSVVDGDRISCTASLSGRYQYVAVSGGTRTIEKYKCPSPEELARLERDRQEYQEQQRRDAEALRQFAKDSAERERRLATPKIISFQQQQASNGYSSFQIELAKRYLRGDGVETNLALARHWLESACTNHDSQATNLLKAIDRQTMR